MIGTELDIEEWIGNAGYYSVDTQPHQEAKDIVNASNWIVITPELFPEGSYGQKYLPEYLVGRARPAEFFDQPLREMRKFSGNNYAPSWMFQRNRLRVFPGDATVMTILGHPFDRDVPGYPRTFTFDVYELFNEASQGPYGSFFGFLVGSHDQQWPISPEAERVRDATLTFLFAEMSYEELDLVATVFGLQNGIVRPYADIAARYGVTDVEVRQKLFGIKKRFQPLSSQLREFAAIDSDSLLYKLSENTCLFDTRHSSAYGKSVDEVDLHRELVPQFKRHFGYRYWGPDEPTFIEMLSHVRPYMFTKSALAYVFSCMKKAGLTDYDEIPSYLMRVAAEDPHCVFYD